MRYLRNIYLLTSVSFALISANVYAETSESSNKNIDRACLKQAVALVDDLKSDVYIDMDSSQSNKIVKLATAACKQEFSQTETIKSIAAVESEEKKESDDWFTNHILNGEVAEKGGNKRLKRLKR
jgi:hypothetical protein